MVLHIIRNQRRLDQVKHLIQTGGDVNAYKSGWTPLLKAAYHGDVDVARKLIKAKADVHLKVKESRSGRTVLHVAAYYICKVWLMFISVLMKLILATTTGVNEQAAVRGAEEDMHLKVRGSGRTALHVAAYYGHQALVKLLLGTSISINEQDDEGRTALTLAVQRGNSDVVAELVKKRADVSVKDKKGMTAVLLTKSYDMVRQLVWDVDRLSREDRSRILWHACNVGKLKMVRSVIEVGCDVDHIHKGQTPVMMATLRGHDSIVKELILANCDVNFKGNVLFRDVAITLNLARLIQTKNTFWMAVLVCILLPWIQLQMDVVTAMWIDPVWGFLVLLVMLAFLGAQLMPWTWIVMLLQSQMFAIAIIVAMRLAMEFGQVAWTGSVMAIVAIPLVRRGTKATMAAVIKEVAGTVVFVTLGMCAGLVILFVVPVIFVWTPRDMSRTEVVAVVLIMVVVVTLMAMLLKGMVPVQWNLLKALLEGVILNVELFVIASSCMMMARKTFVLHEIQTTQSMLELLMTVIIFKWFLLMVLTTQATEMALYRGAAGILVFEAIKLLKMENALVSPDKPQLVLLLIALLLVRGLADILIASVRKAALLKGVVVLLHLVVAMVEAYLALLISKEGGEICTGTFNFGDFVNLTVALAVMASVGANTVTALHYAASYNHIECGVLLVEAGADVFAKNMHLRNPLQIGSESFVEEVQKALSFTTRRVIVVIGNSECGKSTLVAALERTSNILWKKAINHFRKVCDTRHRTAGIEAVPLSNQKYGEALFYDFAGQSQYHGPHQSFLEAMLSKPEVSVTLLLLVKATEVEDTITQQLHRWLQPLALMSIPVTPHVIVVGSFLDQVKSKKVASEKLLQCTQSVQKELSLSIQGPCLLDCRHPESNGINQICNLLQESLPINTTLSYNLHWVLVQVRKVFPTPALRLHEFQTWLQDNAVNLPRNLPSPEKKKVCQDLSAAGHTLFLPNKEDPSQCWLVLDLPALLHNVYGTLFSGSQSKVNEFGLLHCSQLAELFRDHELNQAMLQEVLISLEFCIEFRVDPLLLKEGLSHLTIEKGREGWLYFPALVLAQPCKVVPEDPDPDKFQWMCWQLRTAEKHFISAHLLQTIILRLAANHVYIHKLSPGVKQHCCSVWVNGISWSSTKGVDVAVQISNSSVVQVVGRSNSQSLQEYTAAIVRDVIKTIDRLSPKLEATPYIVHPYTPTVWKDPRPPQPSTLYPVSSVIDCISDRSEYVPPLSPNVHTGPIPISQLFGGQPPPLSTVQDLMYPRVAQNGELTLSLMEIGES